MEETLSHDHEGHLHHHAGGTKRSLAIAFCLTASFMIVEFIGGWLTNSLALISDAGHMLNDAAALGLGFFAVKLGEKPPSMTKTFGYRRVEILAALLNGLTLWVIVGMILHEAWLRMQSPQEIRPVGMMAVAAAGLAINLLSAKVLHSHKEASLNVKGAFLHVLADTLGSLGAIVAGLIIWQTGWTFADPLMSFAICALILASSWGFLKESTHVLLLGVPAHLEFSKVEEAILTTEGVCCVYDLHIWSIQPGTEALSAHVVIAEGFDEREKVLRTLTSTLKEQLGISHVTLQLETSHESLEDEHGFCTVPGARGKCPVNNSGEAKNDCDKKDHPGCRHNHSSEQ
ncbi:cation transporter [bacterium]|nr:MAG: cation transporter [bacterium]